MGPFKRTKRIGITIMTVIAILIIGRAALPPVIKWYVNKTLAELPGYHGEIRDIDVHLWRGAYEIQGLDIVKTDGRAPVPFVSIASTDLSVQWEELFHGALVAKIILKDPKLNFVQSDNPRQEQTSINDSWQDTVAKLFPVKINFFRIDNGEVHFLNPSANPPVDIHLDKLNVTAQNLTNSRDSYKKLLARIDAEGRAMGDGHFQLHTSFNPFAEKPTFDLDSDLSGVDIASLNPFLNHYAGVTAKHGEASFYMEAAGQDGGFRGYVKPFFKDLRFASLDEKELSLGEKIKGAAGNLIAAIFKNRKEKSVASKVEFSGSFEDTNVRPWVAIRTAFRHGFIRALTPQIDNAIKLEKAKA